MSLPRPCIVCFSLLWSVLPIHTLAEQPTFRLTFAPLTQVDSNHPAVQAMVDLINNELDYQTEVYVHDNWLDYTRDLREDKYDLSLSEVHIAAWSSQTGQGVGGSLDHNVVIGVVDFHQSILIANKDLGLSQIKQFTAKRICVSPSPSLNAVNLYSIFNNPVSQPGIIEVKGGNQAVISMLKNNRCDAAIIDKANLIDDSMTVVYQFEAQPGPVMTLAGWHPPATVDLFKEFLSAPEFQNVIVEFIATVLDKNASSVQQVENQDIEGHQQLLSNIWGW